MTFLATLLQLVRWAEPFDLEVDEVRGAIHRRLSASVFCWALVAARATQLLGSR